MAKGRRRVRARPRSPPLAPPRSPLLLATLRIRRRRRQILRILFELSTAQAPSESEQYKTAIALGKAQAAALASEVLEEGDEWTTVGGEEAAKKLEKMLEKKLEKMLEKKLATENEPAAAETANAEVRPPATRRLSPPVCASSGLSA